MVSFKPPINPQCGRGAVTIYPISQMGKLVQHHADSERPRIRLQVTFQALNFSQWPPDILSLELISWVKGVSLLSLEECEKMLEDALEWMLERDKSLLTRLTCVVSTPLKGPCRMCLAESPPGSPGPLTPSLGLLLILKWVTLRNPLEVSQPLGISGGLGLEAEL